MEEYSGGAVACQRDALGRILAIITKQDIIDRATEWQLRAEVVEEDYILGWLLAALSVHEDIQDSWIFKGGTCIKKCFFETYRFSEDWISRFSPMLRTAISRFATTFLSLHGPRTN